jgi:type I restriction enzyme, S subunit
MSATLLKCFDIVADQTSNIPAFRRLVVDLAVRGKLLPAEELDMDAKEMLRRISSKAAAQALDGDIKKQKPLSSIDDQEVPAAYLAHCTFARLGNIANLQKGLTGIQSAQPGGYSLVVTAAGRSTCDHFDFDGAAAIIPLVSSTGHGNASINRLHYQEGKFALGTILCAVFPFDEQLISARFLFEYLTAFKEELLVAKMIGTANVTLTLGKIAEVPVPILAPAVQKRVDELMTLCDQLEAAQQERERRRDRLAAASLQRLNQPAADATPEEQREHARFHLNHLPRLITRPEQIKALRQAILSLAVRGAFSESNGWSLHPRLLKNAATLQNGYAFKSEWFAKTGVRLLRNTNVSHGVIRWDELACLPLDQADEFDRFSLSEGDIVLSLDRPFIGTGTKVARVRATDLPCLLLQRVGRFQLNPDLLISDYLFLWIESPQFTDQIDPGRSNGVPHISSKQVEVAEIFLPPLAEQHRIVAKVDELMALCDQLEAQLTATQTDSRRLLEAVLA